MQAVETYNDRVVRQFTIATIFWGIVGMTRRRADRRAARVAGAQFRHSVADLQPPAPAAHECGDLRVRRLRVCSRRRTTSCSARAQVRLFSDKLAAFTFWGWQTVIVLVAITLPLGITQNKEYAEPEWSIDILITIVWVAFAVVFFGTLATRRVKHIYVANWFYGAYIITIAVLHVVNNVAIPVSLWKS